MYPSLTYLSFRSKAGFFWAGSNLLFTVYLYYRLRKYPAPDPLLISFLAETKGRTYIELDILFSNKVPARKFATTKIGQSFNVPRSPHGMLNLL